MAGKKLIICKRCDRERVHQAKGLCGGCYTFVFRSDYTKAKDKLIRYGLDWETYKRITKSCAICGFDKIVALHHLDKNHENRSEQNLVGLCPNHHRMIHKAEYQAEIFQKLKEKGYDTDNLQKLR